MSDIGPRLDHLMQLQDLWSRGLAILTQPNNYSTEEDKANVKKLENALELLNAHMQKDFVSGQQTSYAQEINNLPKNAKEIPDEKRPDPPSTTWRDTV